MKIEIEDLPEIAVVKVTEGLIGDESDILVSTVQLILDEGTHQFILDLSEVGRADSGGIGSLVAAYTVVAKQSGRMAVVPPKKIVQPLTTGFSSQMSVFETYQSREEAIDALRRVDAVPDSTESETRMGSPGCLMSAGAVLILGAAFLVAAIFL